MILVSFYLLRMARQGAKLLVRCYMQLVSYHGLLRRQQERMEVRQYSIHFKAYFHDTDHSIRYNSITVPKYGGSHLQGARGSLWYNVMKFNSAIALVLT
jgi:hypothetical protein